MKAVYRTAEIGIDPTALASLIRGRVASDPRIDTVFDTEVHGVEIGSRRIGVSSTTCGVRAIAEYDHVVNAWDGRLAVDATAGLIPDAPWLFRVKHFLRVQTTTAKIPSTTMVLGPFGDIVDYGNGAFYLSWYPSGFRVRRWTSSSRIRCAASPRRGCQDEEGNCRGPDLGPAERSRDAKWST